MVTILKLDYFGLSYTKTNDKIVLNISKTMGKFNFIKHNKNKMKKMKIPI